VKKLDRIGMNYDRETMQAKLRHNQPSIGFFDVRISYADEDTRHVVPAHALDGPGPLDTPLPPVGEKHEAEAINAD